MSDLVLITGATGHVGFAVLTEALRKGYKVRSAVRRDSAITQISSEPVIQPYLAQLSFTIVPDITVSGAFDAALESVTHIIHVASPLGNVEADFEKEIIQPAILGTTSILESALKIASIRKIVFTASMFSVRRSDAEENCMLDPDAVVPDPQGPFSNHVAAYSASKVKAHQTVLKFIAQHKPAFSVINVMLSFVVGPNFLAKTPDKVKGGSNMIILSVLLGLERDPRPALVVHVDDVAFVHVAALDDAITGLQNFGLAYNGYKSSIDVNEAAVIVRAKYPKEVQQGIFPLNAKAGSITTRFDIRRTEEVFDFKHKDFESMVVDLADYYLKVWKETQNQEIVQMIQLDPHNV